MALAAGGQGGKVPRFLTELVRKVLFYGTKYHRPFVLTNFATGKSVAAGNKCDRFTVHVSRIVGTFAVQVVFDVVHATMPPDIIPDIATNSDVRLRLDTLPSLRNWTTDDHSALLNVLLDISKAYADAQKEAALAIKNTGLQFILETLHGKNYEVEVTRAPGQTKVTLALTIDTTVNGAAPEPEDFAHVKAEIVLIAADTTQPRSITASAHLSDALIAKTAAVGYKLPTFSANMDLVLYVEDIATELIKAVSAHQKMRAQRQSFVHAAIVAFGARYLAEADTRDYFSVAFLSNASKVPVIVTIRLTAKFPDKQPTIHLLLPFRMLTADKVEDMVEVTEIPYSPRWTPAEMLRRMETRIQQELLKVLGEKNIATAMDRES